MSGSTFGGQAALAWPAACAELSARMVDREPFDETLLRVAQLVKQFVAGVSDASVSMIDHDFARTVVYTGALAIELDEAQYEGRSGPCLDSARSGRTITVINTSPDSAYPQFSELARSRDVLQTVSIGLTDRVSAQAGLNMYLAHDQPFVDDPMSRAVTLANYARAALASDGSPPSQESAAATGVHDAMSSRALVDRAAMSLVERHGYSRDRALTDLLAWSRAQARPLVDVAAALVSS